MPQFRLEAHKTVKKDLKKITPRAVQEIVNKILPKIADNPFIGNSLTGPLKSYSKFVFYFEGVSYRIIYQIYSEQKIIFIIAIGSRGKFYEKLIRRIN